MVSMQKLVEKACCLDNIDVAEAVQWKHMNRVNREAERKRKRKKQGETKERTGGGKGAGLNIRNLKNK